MSARARHAVTGAFGFSGKYLAARLLKAGRQVVTLTNSPGRPHPFSNAVEVRPLAFDRPGVLAEALQDVQVLYNTYWVRFPHHLFTHANAEDNTLALFRAAKDAGVERVVHVSVANADERSPLPYYSGKGRLERALRESGMSHAILRPAVIFGLEDVLINNIVWTLRRMPVIGVFGDGSYRMQPIYVDDLAALLCEQGGSRADATLTALGPEDFTYREWLRRLSAIIGRKRLFLPLPFWLGYPASMLVGKLMGDVFVTRDEIRGLMAGLLHVPGALPAGTTHLTDWARENADRLGIRYANEMARRLDRNRAY
ncbi:MAG: NAD(P)H-binding protein [Desulfovibrio sp.]|jgi:NADH dehydrogenase|nr:NAD(P)H-binding protein [Desulfovibrio sp.]